MNFKTNVYLFIAVVVLIGTLVISQFTGPKKGEEGRLLPGIDPKDVTRVTVERKLPAESKLVFVRTGKDQWKLEEPYEARLDGKQVESLLTSLTSATMVTKGADLTSDPAKYGLDRPAVIVTLDAGGKNVTVNFGQVTLGSADISLAYVNTSEHKAPAAIKRWASRACSATPRTLKRPATCSSRPANSALKTRSWRTRGSMPPRSSKRSIFRMKKAISS